MKVLYSLIQSPLPAHFSDLYQELGIAAERFDSARNLHRALQKQPPDFFVGEFIYGWGNDYAGATVSNLDVTLRTLHDGVTSCVMTFRPGIPGILPFALLVKPPAAYCHALTTGCSGATLVTPTRSPAHVHHHAETPR